MFVIVTAINSFKMISDLDLFRFDKNEKDLSKFYLFKYVRYGLPIHRPVVLKLN